MYKTLVVVDNDDILIEDDNLTVISFERYLSEYPKLNEPKTRIINLCDTEYYLSKGYYCSLLAEARQHKVLPSVSTINDLRDLSNHIDPDFSMFLPLSSAALKNLQSEEFLLFFGSVESEPWKRIAKLIYEKYPAPILHFQISRGADGIKLQVKRFSFVQLDKEQRARFLVSLKNFTWRVWRNTGSQKRYRWEMAILVNPDEPTPPSNKEAIKRFIQAAAKVGIHAETITSHQMGQLAEYDALFIRETTAIDHHTYRMARKAEQEGLVVIDDSNSILRCCNKVFLHDAFTYNQVPSPKTRVTIGYSDKDIDKIEKEFSYPLVLKTPEGSFSKGVFKVTDRQMLIDKLKNQFEETALVLVQEFLYTDFDWRIGVLNGRAIYACRYHMAKNHWQIYNHGSKRFSAGNFETLPTFEAPKEVLDAAIKACDIIGRGLYGVDVKQRDKEIYVIEVNDNPNLDHKIEDLFLGNELYMLIMGEFVNRLEKRGVKQ